MVPAPQIQIFDSCIQTIKLSLNNSIHYLHSLHSLHSLHLLYIFGEWKKESSVPPMRPNPSVLITRQSWRAIYFSYQDRLPLTRKTEILKPRIFSEKPTR